MGRCFATLRVYRVRPGGAIEVDLAWHVPIRRRRYALRARHDSDRMQRWHGLELKRLCIYVYMYNFVCLYVLCVYVCIDLYYVCIIMYICMYVCMYVYVYVYVYI